MTSPLIYGQLAKVMGAVGAVTKGRRNQQQGYQFRGIDDVQAHVQSVLAEHGVICVPRVVERERELIPTKSGGSMASVRLLVEHTFYAADGSHVVCTTLGEAMDSGDKASNKAMSAALKYALTETLMIPTYEVDQDTEEHSPEVAPPPPRVQERSTPPQRPQDTRGQATRDGGRVSEGNAKAGEGKPAWSATPEGQAFAEVAHLLMQVWPGAEGQKERIHWWWQRYAPNSRAEMPADWTPMNAWGQSDDRRKAKILETAKSLVESETHPDDRSKA